MSVFAEEKVLLISLFRGDLEVVISPIIHMSELTLYGIDFLPFRPLFLSSTWFYVALIFCLLKLENYFVPEITYRLDFLMHVYHLSY